MTPQSKSKKAKGRGKEIAEQKKTRNWR